MKTSAEYDLITGASKGLGREMAKVLAKRNHNLILVSLPGEGLYEFGQLIKMEMGIDVKCYECDLTQKNEIENLVNWIKEHFEINILINNAGIGCTQEFLNLSYLETDRMLLLNIRTVVLLTHGLLPILKRQKQAYILNIASMASFSPMPFKGIYPASKAFVYSFSRGLYGELKGSNVFVSVAHPGGMATNPEVCERINGYNRIIRSTILSPEQTAEICIRQLLKKDSLIIPGIMNKISWLVQRIIPVWLQLMIFRITIRRVIGTSSRIKTEPKPKTPLYA
jgi:uncharacterized protein